MASLFVIQGADQGKRFELKSEPVALGRDSSNPIRLHDTEVSRRHAEVRYVDDTFQVIDLGSANGTFVNGQLVDQSPLRSGDRLQVAVKQGGDGGGKQIGPLRQDRQDRVA